MVPAPLDQEDLVVEVLVQIMEIQEHQVLLRQVVEEEGLVVIRILLLEGLVVLVS